MIGYGIFFCNKLCGVKENGTYAICVKKEFAEEYAKELSRNLRIVYKANEYKTKKVNIEVLE